MEELIDEKNDGGASEEPEALESITEPMSLQKEEESLEQTGAFGGKKKFKLLFIFGVILLILIIGGAGFWVYQEYYKESGEKNLAQRGATAVTTEAGQETVPADELDKDLTGIDNQFKSLEKETQKIDEGLADKPEDLSE